jgi:hypothetical protein
MPDNPAGKPEKIDIQKEVFAKDIERVEELRYWISIKTYDSLRKKRTGKAQAAADIDRQINEMRKEFEHKNQRLKEAGIDYLIVNKKQLNNLREKFMQIGPDDRDNALEGTGEGAKIIDEMNDLLQCNFNKKMEIARLIISFNSLSGDKGKVKEAIEGDQEFTIAELKGDDSSLNKFFNAADELGFLCKRNKNGKTLVCRHEEEEEKKEESKDIGFIPELPGIPQQSPQPKPIATQPTTPAQKPIPAPVSPPPQIQKPLAPIPKPQPAALVAQPEATAALNPQDAEAEKENEGKRQEMEKKAMLNVADMSKEEVEGRMKKILTNIKMQRWVLGTFKDMAEKEEYEKAQILLAALMKRKRETEGTK